MSLRDAVSRTPDDHDEHHDLPLSLDTAVARPQRPASIHQPDDGEAKIELESIMTTASNPVSPGPSSPPLDQIHTQSFVPPARPKSTPFPQPEQRTDDLRCSCPHSHFSSDGDDLMELCPSSPTTTADQRQSARLNLNDLPAEIHECILDHLFGYRVSTASKSSMGMNSVTKSWATALRHSRRRELSELALVSNVWRVLIQDRLYRHIKLKATHESLSEALIFFAENPHMRFYVKHIEIWFPVFQAKREQSSHASAASWWSPAWRELLPTMTPDGTSPLYTLPQDNCSLEETFYFVGSTFPEVRVLTLEGGERKKAPMVRHFSRPLGGGANNNNTSYPAHPVALPRIDSVRTLVCKGQWNLIRDADDFDHIAAALPQLKEWHASYSKPKSKTYLSMAAVLPRLPLDLTSLHLCLESDYRRELSFPPYFLKVANEMHFCLRLAECAPALEHLSFTGRVCRGFFDAAARLADPRCARLKSVDLVVKNCCRHVAQWSESGSGITDMGFIAAFEALVLAGVRALERFKGLEYMRIRYVDLDSPAPPLNPYFLMRSDGVCSGVWSDAIVSELGRVRPAARFEDLSEMWGEVVTVKDGQRICVPEFPRKRVLSLKLSNYALLAGGIHIVPSPQQQQQ
ncbi:uncharacterized protein E0L32_004529 [Thyridium curvatum]|uniref:Uncharacterized protein n=1 Tax=Thyridium curvatum TaxID=1093900 RepID=A0A507AZ38_9PEZI|nr:uncharacterized protein E0L32_004529 [Thyridium curvatum]TPX15252.1 hypothetical protein E0L32_004529 [Thyridium curvatum]